jgi:hypothetical protein
VATRNAKKADVVVQGPQGADAVALDQRILDVLKAWVAGKSLDIEATLLDIVKDNPFTLPRAKALADALGDAATPAQKKLVIRILGLGKSKFDAVKEAGKSIKTATAASANATQIANKVADKVMSGVAMATAIESVQAETTARTQHDLGVALILRIQKMLGEGAALIAAIKLDDPKAQARLADGVSKIKAVAL